MQMLKRGSPRSFTFAFTATVIAALALAREARAADPTTATEHLYELASARDAMGIFDEAADAYERYAADVTAVNADRALFMAALLRFGLGTDDDVRKAKDDVARFQRAYGAARPAQSAELALALSTHYAEKGSGAESARVLREANESMAAATVDIRTQAHALLGRTYAKQSKERAVARAEYSRAVAIWNGPDAAAKQIQAAYPKEDDAQRSRRLERSIDAVGEAYVFLAYEADEAAVKATPFPKYAGPNRRADLHKHVATKVREWIAQKVAAIEKVELEYQKVFALSSAPPPRWVVAARRRIAVLWGKFVAEFRQASYPKEWKQHGCAVDCNTAAALDWNELRSHYLALLDEASEPIKKDRAKRAFVTCLADAKKLRYFDASSRACEVWLEKNYPDEYPPVEEIRAAPTLTNAPPVDKEPPLRSGRSD